MFTYTQPAGDKLGSTYKQLDPVHDVPELPGFCISLLVW